MKLIGKQFLKDAVMWGVILWIIGYALGMALFAFVPLWVIGWIIMPIGIVITLWVAVKKVKGTTLGYYLGVGAIWAVLAVVLDYFLLVKAFNPVDGYYKLDVYIYYALTFLIPVVVGLVKTRKPKTAAPTPAEPPAENA